MGETRSTCGRFIVSQKFCELHMTAYACPVPSEKEKRVLTLETLIAMTIAVTQ